MNRNYNTPTAINVPQGWAEARGISMALALAIHAVADSTRTADAIYENPTPAEIDHVNMAMQEHGLLS